MYNVYVKRTTENKTPTGINYKELYDCKWYSITLKLIHYINRHLIFYKSFSLMIASICRNQLPLFKIIKYKVLVFVDVYIVFHFNIILNTMECPLLSLT